MWRAALLSIALVTGCATAAADGSSAEADALSTPKVQPNDVSILFPLEKTGLLTPDDGTLLPQDVYEAAVGKAGTLGPGGIPGVDRAGLQLVAARFDPCFATLKPIEETPDCENQLRVVFEPLDKDAAVHVFYKLTREELTAAVREVAALRGDADLGPLGVHPLMKKEGLKGPTAKAMKAIILKYASKANLSRFTLMSSSGLGTAWNFRGFDIANGVATPMEIPAVPAGTKTVAFFRGFTKNTLAGDFTPATTSDDNLQLFANVSKAKSASADARKAAFDAAVRIEDPSVHSPNTIDCASCHAAQPVRSLVGEAMLGFASTPIAGETKAQNADDVDVHMFSYKGTQPSIHRRTVVETGAIAKYLSGVL